LYLILIYTEGLVKLSSLAYGSQYAALLSVDNEQECVVTH